MSTIEVSVKDAREGDHFTGRINYGGVDYDVTGRLQETTGKPGHLYVSSWLPYVRSNSFAGTTARWTDVTVLREVEDFAIGTVVRSLTGVYTKTDEGWVWVNYRENRFSNIKGDHSEEPIRSLIEDTEAEVIYDPKVVTK